MTIDDVRRQNLDRALRRPPWADSPGHFLAQLVPSGLVDPAKIEAAGMMAAIVIARELYGDHKAPAVRLRVTRDDGSESFYGML